MESRNYEDTVAMLAPSQLKVLKTLAAPPFNGAYSADFKQRSGVLNNQTIKKAIQRLEDLRIIFRVKGIPRISNPYFGLWIKKKL